MSSATQFSRAREATVGLAPGSNRHRELSYADWRFIIPTSGYSDVLFLGIPKLSVLETLSRTLHRIVVATTDRHTVGLLNAELESRHLQNVRSVHVASDGDLPFDHGSFDLVVLAATAVAAPRRSSRLIGELARIVRPDGTVYMEAASVTARSLARRWTRQSRGLGVWTAHQFWLVRRNTDVLSAIPLGDVDKLAGYFFRDVLYGRSRIGRALAPVARWLVRHNLLHRVAPARALVLRRHRSGRAAESPFRYLVELGERNGLNLSEHRVALLARGAYDSNKVAVYFFERLRNIPDVIVKMTRTPDFNHRLETEYRSLRALGRMDIVDPSTYPEALMLDEHRGLAVLAQKVVAGAPFRVRTTSRPDCPFARDAIGWITRLGAASADFNGAAQQEVSSRLSNLLDNIAEVYGLAQSEWDFLHERVKLVDRSQLPIPLVVRHGDAGTWNVLVTNTGRAAFLDWEASEMHGPPLWDLFDFIRSFGTWVGRVSGERSNAVIYESAFLTKSLLAGLQRNAVRDYCDRVGLQRELIEPLFYSCWMQRALREAAWTSKPLANGTYIDLLRLCIRGRGSPGLQWLLD